jgi:cytoskeletal protein CcmA (bactofilin family)
VIGTDLTILGQSIVILSQNRLKIDGDIRGDVAGKEVIISAEGSIIGTVSAERIVIYGGVKGAIRAPLVIVHASAEVDADILHRSLQIDEGAKVDGRVRHARDDSELRPNLDPAAYAFAPPSAT